MIKTLRNTVQHTHTLDLGSTLKSITTYAWIGAGVLFVAYVYFVGAITFSVVKEQAMQQETKTLISTMGQAELQYLAQQKSLTQSYAYAQGFVSAEKIAFALPQRAFAWNVGR